MAGRFQVAGCAIIEKKGKVLITRRNKDRWLGMSWEFVSGRLEQGEDMITGIKREVKEEVNLEIKALYPIYASHFYRGVGQKRIEIPENEVIMVSYACKWLKGEVHLKLDEQDKYEWVDLKKINLVQYPGLKEYYQEEIEAYLKMVKWINC